MDARREAMPRTPIESKTAQGLPSTFVRRHVNKDTEATF